MFLRYPRGNFTTFFALRTRFFIEISNPSLFIRVKYSPRTIFSHTIRFAILLWIKNGVYYFSIFNGFRENWIYVPKSQKIPFLPIFDTWHRGMHHSKWPTKNFLVTRDLLWVDLAKKIRWASQNSGWQRISLNKPRSLRCRTDYECGCFISKKINSCKIQINLSCPF